MAGVIGVLFGMEESFPPALVERINAMGAPGVSAEFVNIGGIRMDEPARYRVIVDRISHDIPFYRAYLKNAALAGTAVINNPFWWSADDKLVRLVVLDDSIANSLYDELFNNESRDERMSQLPAVFKRLKSDELQLIELRFLESRSFKEVADILGITENNTKVRTYRILEKMRKILRS
jgi:RNA polymerase sigma factor (sigma-70 family)